MAFTDQPVNYPSVDVRMNREMAGHLCVTAEQVGRSLTEATASSRFTTPNYWTVRSRTITPAFAAPRRYPRW